MTDAQTESQRAYYRPLDNDGGAWVCPQCGSTKDGPSVTTMCPKGCQMMVRAKNVA